MRPDAPFLAHAAPLGSFGRSPRSSLVRSKQGRELGPVVQVTTGSLESPQAEQVDHLAHPGEVELSQDKPFVPVDQSLRPDPCAQSSASKTERNTQLHSQLASQLPAREDQEVTRISPIVFE